MTDTAQTTSLSSSPIPADDPSRKLTVADPDGVGVRHVSVVGGTYTILVSGADTAGRYCLVDMLVPDGAGPPAHRHDFEEMFTVLEGELEFFFRGQALTGPRRVHCQHPGERPPPIQEHVRQDGPYALRVHAGGTGGVVHSHRHPGRQPDLIAAESESRRASQQTQAAGDAATQIPDRNGERLSERVIGVDGNCDNPDGASLSPQSMGERNEQGIGDGRVRLHRRTLHPEILLTNS